MIRVAGGWYQDEYDANRDHAWRWMQGASTAYFPPLPADGVLRLHLHVPLDAVPKPPAITISWNGRIIDHRTCDKADLDLQYQLPSRHDAANECRITTDQVGAAPGDSRHFGLQLTEIAWERAH
jgi:hypothetical protein